MQEMSWNGTNYKKEGSELFLKVRKNVERTRREKHFQTDGVQSWNPDAHLSGWCKRDTSGRNLGCGESKKIIKSKSVDSSQ